MIIASSNDEEDQPSGALHLHQIHSVLMFQLIGNILILLLISSFFAYFRFDPLDICVVLVLITAFCVWPLNRAVIQASSQLQNIIFPSQNTTSTNNNDNPTCIYQIKWRQLRLAQPREGMCYLALMLYFTIFFLYPIIALYKAGNYPIARTFIILAPISFIYKHYDPSTILCELGNLDKICFRVKDEHNICGCCDVLGHLVKRILGIKDVKLSDEEINMNERSRIAQNYF